MMFLDDRSPTTGGREIWGFPKKIGNPDLRVIHDTLTGTLHYAEREVALGTMAYKYQSLAQDHGETLAAMKKLNVNLKWIPDVDGRPKIAQLVGERQSVAAGRQADHAVSGSVAAGATGDHPGATSYSASNGRSWLRYTFKNRLAADRSTSGNPAA